LNSEPERRSRRNVDGILLLDKPVGVSSNQALRKVKGLFGAAKAGHTGSLDPFATGMLVICFGQATKISGQLLEASKTYSATLKLGQASDSFDADGHLGPELPVPAHTEAEVHSVLARFAGEGSQVPPMYSALKHKGQRLYKLARAGVEVERAARPITIHSIELEAFEPPLLRFAVHCSKGTYIRVLGGDMAQMLGTEGHLVGLRRTSVGPFTGAMHSLESLAELADQGPGALDSVLLPVDRALEHLPAVKFDAKARDRLVQGQQASGGDGLPAGERVRLYGPGGRFLGTGEIKQSGEVAPKRLFLL
jgi:tRNA pseudouridine55 synthase